MNCTHKAGFTLLELTFVIVIIGILSAVAIPRLSATRDDAVITKAVSTISAVRNALATEKQKRTLRGNYTPITDLAYQNGAGNLIFDFYDSNNTAGTEVLEYPIRACADATERGCWITGNTDLIYIYRMPASTVNVTFTLTNSGKFTCDPSNATTGTACKTLTE